MAASDDARLIAATRTPEFWRCYVCDERDGFDLATEREQLDEQLADGGQSVTRGVGGTRVTLPARRGWWLLLTLDFAINMHSLSLCSDEDAEEELDREPAVQRELGHWDEIRWHPFCLRWQELEAVVRWLRANPGRQACSPGMAMLLLAPWVGHGADEGELLAVRRRIIAAELEGLGVFHGDEAKRVAALLLTAAPEDDYAWRRDADRGWTFRGDYPCYSNRNDGHDFPFAEFAEFRRQLGVIDERTTTA